ncbi:MAG: response regulator transcription factor [Candidatus Kapabacteria bacterium]|nr:response regulator transcription factor [Candidatus Kapabacteria bacterium]MBX7155762.1 LytTR family DNA-binding domain-containing protein [Bacteroidota bacterium]
MHMNAVIIDDEESGRETLQHLLARFCADVTVVATADSPDNGIAAIKQHNPDLVFLDVEMPGGTGFTVLEAFPQLSFHVIFVTAYQHYAMKAIKFSALDYLLKPVDVQELQKAVGKATQHKQQQVTVVSKPHADSIAVPVEDGLIFLNPADILRCESDSNYTQCFLLSGQKLLVSRTLKEFDELLSPHDFMRVHNSHLVNLRCVNRYVRGKGGYAVMKDGSEIEVSPRKRDEFLECFARL